MTNRKPIGSIVCLLLALAACRLVPADEDAKTSGVIELETRELDFAPTRDDLQVGTAVVAVFSPKGFRLNGETVDTQWKSIELERRGRNKFKLPPLKIEFSEDDGGFLCLSVKVWFDALANEFDSPYYRNTDDRYALVSYCGKNATGRVVRARFSQNRVKTLEDFEARLAKPIPIPLENARVPSPGIAFDREGTLFALCYLDGLHLQERNQLWRLAGDGTKSRVPLAGSRSASWRVRPHTPAVDRGGVIFLSGLLKVAPDGEVVKVPQPWQEPSAADDTPVATDLDGNLYFATTERERGAPPRVHLARLNPDGAMEIVSGSVRGHADGPAESARFVEISAMTTGCATGVAAGRSSDIWVADGREGHGSWIRRVAADGTVTTIAGSEELGFADGKGAAARFRVVSALALGPAGELYAADRFNDALRRIDLDGSVTTIAGRGASTAESGPAREARFEDLAGVAVSPDGAVYVLDEGRERARVRRISSHGVITTITTLP